MVKGWRSESARHALARKGIKTGRKIPISSVKTRTITRYTSPEGFEFAFEPIEDSIIVKKTKHGYEARYLTPDMDAESPEAWGDDSLFLVHYHRDFNVENDNLIKKDDARKWYQGEKIPQQKDYWIFPVEAYIHSGVHLTLDTHKGKLPQGHYEFDTSNVGLVLVSKKEFKTRKSASKSAESLIDAWNMYLGNDVYGIVKEIYNEKKGQVEHYEVWGHYGYKAAMKELESFEGFE